MAPGDVTRDRRRRHTFWLDDAIVDRFAPAMHGIAYAADAIAVYTVLARRADRDGESWPGVPSIARQAATSERTAQRALRLLEALGLVEIAACFEAGTNRQTSNLYTLLTPPDIVPQLDRDPAHWPAPQRRVLVVEGGNRALVVADTRSDEDAAAQTPCQADTPSPVRLAPPGCQVDTPPVSGWQTKDYVTEKDNTVKDWSCTGAMTAETWIVAEVGMPAAQVWAAVLHELQRRGAVPRQARETWIGRSALVGREGDTLVIGAPGEPGVLQVRRWAVEIRAAVRAVLGGAQDVRVVAA